jgi:glucan 1,3-beta-glucosidase
VLEDVLAVAKRDGFRASVIEAFDQPWKRQLEGTVGGHWGLLDGSSRAPKFAWGVLLSNHPMWAWQVAAGVLLAAATFLAAGAAGGRGSPPAAAQWFGVGAIALVPGVLIGWAIANVPLESLGVGGWVHSLAMLAVALLAPIVGAAALMRNIPVPAFSDVLGYRKHRCAPLGFALGVAWVVLCAITTEVALGLAFDPRYRDFPFAPLGAGAAPFVILALLGAGGGRRELAEIAMAAVLAAATLYIAWNEGPANWQSLCLCAVFAVLILTLLRSQAAPSSK